MHAFKFEAPDTIILSHQRSGTHLLASSLASHPAIHGRGECVLAYKRLILKMIEDARVADRISRLVNKPGYINVGIVMYSQVALFEQLCGPLPNHKIIHLLRNPRNVAMSLAQMRADRAALGKAFKAHYHLTEQPHSHLPISAKMVDELEKGVSSLHRQYQEILHSHSKIMTVSYEDITQNKQIDALPEEIARVLLEFLGLSYHPLKTRLIKTGGTGSMI